MWSPTFFTVVLIGIFFTAYGTTVPSFLDEVTRDMPEGDSKVEKVTKDMPEAESKLEASDKQVGSRLRAAFILCERQGSKPGVGMYYTRLTNGFIFPRVSPTCKTTFVSGTANGSTKFNHRDLWNGQFTGLDFYYERLYTCSTGSVSIIRRIGSFETTVFRCNAPYEAHVVTIGV